MQLGDVLKIAPKGNGKTSATFTISVDTDALKKAVALLAAAGPLPGSLGDPNHVATAMAAAIHQDDDAHDTCTLTACLNPLHPGPCKGWKHSLFQSAPQAWHALEAARVEKANANRLKKIEHLKSQGLPIPKKLLTEIKAKPHPHPGKAASHASGGAHAAGQAVSNAAGVHPNAPGKVVLGQAGKKLGDTLPKGPKGKKPTLASKGIAFVIGQEKVTPQYKLDKAATITPEQWAGLSHEDKNSIRDELKKIQKDGFGPQQKKATDLLAKLPEPGKEPAATEPKIGDLKPGTPGTITTPSGKTYQKVELKKPAEETPKPGSTSAQADAMIALADAIPGVKAGSMQDKEKLQQVIDKLKESGPLTEHPKIKLLVSKLAGSALGAAHDAKMPGLGHGSNDVGISEFHKEISEHIEHGKPGLPPLVAKMVAHHEAAKNGEAKPGNVKTGVENLVKNGLPPKAEEKPKAEPTKLSEVATKATAVTTGGKIENKAEKAPDLPKHVQHAKAMADGTAPGASWSKNHLAAYQPLTAEEFHALSPQHQQKIVAELEKAKTKFLDPKKVKAAEDTLTKFGHGPDAVKAPKAEAKAVDFAKDMHDHTVSAADAKKAAAGASVASLAEVAKKTAGVTALEDPDNPDISKGAEVAAQSLLDHATSLYDSKITGQPGVKQAMADFKQAMTAELHARAVEDAKHQAYKKITQTLTVDDGKLSPIEKASLQAYQKHLLNHPIKSSTADIDALSVHTKATKQALTDKLQSALKQANAPKPEDMTPAQLDSRVKELLGDEVVDPTKPKVHLSLAETQNAKKMGQASAKSEAEKYPASVLGNPAVAAKQQGVENAATQYLMTGYSSAHLADHIKQLHQDALKHGTDVHGDPLTADDKKVLELHIKQLQKDHAYLSTTADEQLKKLNDAKAAFHAAAEKAAATPAEPVKLSDYDHAAITEVYSNAWGKAASKATTYGVTYDAAQKMKAHPDYPAFTQDLGNLKALSGKVAIAHAEENAAHLNVPTNPDTGDLEHGPEWDAWQNKVAQRAAIEKQFNDLHKQAQAKLDKIRVDSGLKKRALPKIDATAVKSAAAETAFYKTGGYSGPNYGKPSAAKQYLVAKLGGKLGVAHQSAAEKKMAKTLGEAAGKAPSTPKIENTTPGTPVKLGGDSSIAHVPASLKKTITGDFKGMPKGKYLGDPTEDVFDNLVNLAAAHGKDVPGGLSVSDVLKTIDETHSKNLGVANSGMLEKKVTEWLATPAGKAYAEAHSVPDPKVVKQLNGELDLPPGVVLKPGEKVQKLAGPGPHDESLPHSAFHKASSTSAQIAQDQYMKDNGIKWTAAQKKSLKSYTGSAYTAYNTYLRKGGSLSPEYKQDIINIQSAMMPLPQHTLLRRGTGWDALPEEFHGFENAKKLLGKTIEEPGFTSTTVAGESGHFGGPLQLEIEAPKGSAAAFVNGLSHFKNKENEMLLAAGTKFKVLSVEQKGHQTVMRVRIVGDK